MEQYQLLIMLFVVAIVVAITMGIDPLSMLRSSSNGSSNDNRTMAPNLNIIASI